MLGSLFTPKSHNALRGSTVKACTLCGSTWRDLRESGKVGCAKCYDVFRDELESTVQSIHGRAAHVGRHPADRLTASDTVDAKEEKKEEKEEKKENLEGKQRNSKNRTALDTQKEETMDWNTAFAVLRKFYEEKWDYLNGCPRNEKAWDEEGELQCKIYVSKKRGLDRDQRMEVLKLYETMEDRKVREAVRVICG